MKSLKLKSSPDDNPVWGVYDYSRSHLDDNVDVCKNPELYEDYEDYKSDVWEMVKIKIVVDR